MRVLSVEQIEQDRKDNARVNAVRAARAARREAKRAHAERRAAELEIERGQIWTLTGTSGIEHEIHVGDGLDLTMPTDATLVLDPPWDAMPPVLPWTCESVLAFTDAPHLRETLALLGHEVAWSFVWDCGSCHAQGKRPMQRHKMCLWYGDLRTFRFHRADVPTALLPNGAKISDLYAEPLTTVVGTSRHPHPKPLLWMTHLVGRCAREVVVDPYLGSGSTLLACEATGRRCVGAEIDPAWAAVTIDRGLASGMSAALLG